MDKERKIYLIVRNDLKMGKGKIAAQCGHAIQELIIRCPKKILLEYLASGVYPKIVLKVDNEEKMDNIRDKCREASLLYHQVIDAGRTQIPSGSKTVLGVGPVSDENVPECFKELKLL